MKIKVFAPASIGNIGPGFDVLGMAVTGAGDIIEAEISEKSGITIINADGMSKDPEKNTAGIAAYHVLKKLNENKGIKLSIKKGIPPGSGMGSSAASAVAAGFAVNYLFGNKLSKMELIEPITKAEEAVSGSYFCDNTGSSLLGGIILIRGRNDVIHLGNMEMYIALVKPDITVLTKDARNILPKEISLRNMIHNSSHTAGIVAGLLLKDKKLFGSSIDDKVIEPIRSRLIPGFYDVKDAAIKAGALGCSIAGSGPAIFAACESEEICKKVTEKMKEAFEIKGHKCLSFVSKIDVHGARII
jgi:homoserine kinase